MWCSKAEGSSGNLVQLFPGDNGAGERHRTAFPPLLWPTKAGLRELYVVQ